jgi:nitrite reductase (NADH) small subunit
MRVDHVSTWVDICEVQRITPFSGVAAMVNGEQVAIFRLTSDKDVYAISNYDPFSKAFVLSRGIVGDKQGVLKVASPIYKHNFNLQTGECLDDPRVKLPIYPVQVIGGRVQVGLV